MELVKVFKNGKQVDIGIFMGGRYGGSGEYACKRHEQTITITHDTTVDDESYYTVADGYEFQVFQDNGEGWDLVWDSIEMVNREVEYDIGWFGTSSQMCEVDYKMVDGYIMETGRHYL